MEVRLLGKKGMFLTFISIAIIAAVIIIFTPSDINLKKDMSSIKTRTSRVNDYVLDLENVYLERALQSSGTKTIMSLILYMDKTDSFLTDIDANFTEVLLKGTIGGTPIDDITGQNIMKDNTYINWINRIINISRYMFNIDTSFDIHGIKIYQVRPWLVNVEANISFMVSTETASWAKNSVIKTEIGIEKFYDPYYLVNTNGAYANKIRKSGTISDEWNVDKVKDFIRDGNYTHWENSNAPSFLMRFTNDISPSSCCGIESLVNPNNPAISNQDTSYADYLYWSTTPDCDSFTLYSINNINAEFPNFKLDPSHVTKYNLADEAQQICPLL
ncbi:MAG: hypothetical protein V1831_00380 [Candidatus Woesearchaeota archaeon]